MSRSTATLLSLPLLTFALAMPAHSQVGGAGGIGGGGIGRIGSGFGGSGIGGGFAPRSGGGGLRNSPIANPAPSLTPHEVFHPRGSLSPAQIRNPSPSLFRPRSGGSQGPNAGRAKLNLPRGGNYGSVGNGSAARTQVTHGSGLGPNPALVRAAMSPEQQLASGFARLARDLDRYSNGRAWANYLRLPRGKAADNADALDKLLARFDKLSTRPEYQQVWELAGYQAAHRALAEFVGRRLSD